MNAGTTLRKKGDWSPNVVQLTRCCDFRLETRARESILHASHAGRTVRLSASNQLTPGAPNGRAFDYFLRETRSREKEAPQGVTERITSVIACGIGLEAR